MSELIYCRGGWAFVVIKRNYIMSRQEGALIVVKSITATNAMKSGSELKNF